MPSSGGQDTGSEAAAALTSTNGLNMINGLSAVNGLNMINGLAPDAGLMTTADGRTTVSYLVRCALPVGRTISKTFNGTTYKFSGEIGVAPEWETGACSKDCQEYMTACMLAHINTSGQHIALWLDGDNKAIGWGQNTDYPYQEGSFFGNIFVSPPQAYYCNGKDFDKGLVPGRLGDASGAIYKNPYAAGTSYCKDYCVAADAPNAADGYKACGAWKHVVTVWRNFDPKTDYKVCNRFSGKCLDFSGASNADGATLMQYPANSASSQHWRITQISPRKYKVVNANSGKALDVSGGNTSNGAKTQQWPYNGGPNQMWTFTPTGDGYYRFGPGSNANGCIGAPSGSTASSDVVQWSYDGGANQQWNIVPNN